MSKAHRLIVSESSEAGHSLLSPRLFLNKTLGILLIPTFLLFFFFEWLHLARRIFSCRLHLCVRLQVTLRRYRELSSIPRERRRHAGRFCTASLPFLRCPVLKRIYMAATGYRTGSPRRYEALKTKVRLSGS